MFETLILKVKARLYEWALSGQISARQRKAAEAVGLLMDAEQRATATSRALCHHLKGGFMRLSPSTTDGHAKVMREAMRNGSGTQYAVTKHKHLNGDIWVQCIRCGKKWTPPIRSEYNTDRAYYQAVEEYERAKEFPTNNHMSESVLCAFKLNGSRDAGDEYVRKQMANS